MPHINTYKTISARPIKQSEILTLLMTQFEQFSDANTISHAFAPISLYYIERSMKIRTFTWKKCMNRASKQWNYSTFQNTNPKLTIS